MIGCTPQQSARYPARLTYQRTELRISSKRSRHSWTTCAAHSGNGYLASPNSKPAKVHKPSTTGLVLNGVCGGEKRGSVAPVPQTRAFDTTQEIIVTLHCTEELDIQMLAFYYESNGAIIGPFDIPDLTINDVATVGEINSPDQIDSWTLTGNAGLYDIDFDDEFGNPQSGEAYRLVSTMSDPGAPGGFVSRFWIFPTDGTDFSGGTATDVSQIGFDRPVWADIICFTRGVLIKSAKGEVPVERLTEGDHVLTMDAGYQPIRWIGSNWVDAAGLDANPKLIPIRILAGALGNGLPEQDIVVSPQHRVLISSVIAERIFDIREVLVPANKLLAMEGIDLAEDMLATGVEYWHFLFDAHQIVWSNGAPTESLFTGPEALKAVSPEAREEITTLFPEITLPDYVVTSARHIPQKGKLMKKLAQRHQKNHKPVVEAAGR